MCKRAASASTKEDRNGSPDSPPPARPRPGRLRPISPQLVEGVKRQPGFLLHVASEDSQGFCVAEVWDSQEQHDAWFNNNVAPNIPTEIKQKVVQLHAIHRP
jgi:quinol monooxygenase YgiN